MIVRTEEKRLRPETLRLHRSCFAVEAAEVIKILLKKQGALKSSMLMIDLLNHQYDVVEF